MQSADNPDDRCWRCPPSRTDARDASYQTRVRWVTALGCLTLAGSLWSCGGGSTITAPTVPSRPETPGLACGVERWFVKTLSDQDAGSVNVAAVTPISLRELNGFATHCTDIPDRRAFPEEFKVFETMGRITYVARENDRDYHVALEDPNAPGFTVVAELADILCVGAVLSPHLSSLTAADAMWRVLLDNRSPSTLVGTMVRVRGVGFYDFAHGQRGRSQNCIELHPILAIVRE